MFQILLRAARLLREMGFGKWGSERAEGPLHEVYEV